MKTTHLLRHLGLLAGLLLATCLPAGAQAYLGRVSGTAPTALRSGPGSGYRALRSLRSGRQLFVSSLAAPQGYYSVIDIGSGTEGYVPRSRVRLLQPLAASPDGIFSREGDSYSAESAVEVYNRSAKYLTLRLNDTSYHFAPQERRSLSLPGGTYAFRASAPGVIPYFGTDDLEGGGSYSWEFYIVTRYR